MEGRCKSDFDVFNASLQTPFILTKFKSDSPLVEIYTKEGPPLHIEQVS